MCDMNACGGRVVVVNGWQVVMAGQTRCVESGAFA